MQNYNLHTHTYRCGHAVGDEYEIAFSAINNGFNILGFSEHIAYEDWDNDYDRMPFRLMDGYFESIEKLKEEYKDKIEIYTGLEIEYFPETEDYLKEIMKRCDYMILGEHSINKFGQDLSIACTDEEVKVYADRIVEAIEKGFTKYICHPSYFMYSRDNFSEACANAIEKIALSCKKNDCALEMNLKGMSKGRRNYGNYESYIYPHLKSFEIIREIDPMIVIGYDVHDPAFLNEREYEMKIRRLIDGANIVKDPEMFLFKNF